MPRQIELSEAEWALVLELLQAEYKELPAEIHHTRTQHVHEELKQRKRLVEGLIARLQQSEHCPA